MDENTFRSSQKRLIIHQVPKDFDLGIFPVGQTTNFKIELQNNADTPKRVQFSECAFEIEPKEARLAPNQQVTFNIVLKNNLARVVVTKTKLTVEDEGVAIVKMSAIFKFGHIQLASENLNFGSVFPETTKEDSIVIHNPSLVPASYIVRTVGTPEKISSSIQCLKSEGLLAPGASSKLMFKYSPMVDSYTTVQIFELLVNGLVNRQFEVRGRSSRVSISIDQTSFDFGPVKRETKSRMTFTLMNNALKSTQFEILGGSTVYQIDKPIGVIPSRSSIKIVVTFAPLSVGVFSTTLYCIVRNQDVVTLNLTGSCYMLKNLSAMMARKSVQSLAGSPVERKDIMCRQNSLAPTEADSAMKQIRQKFSEADGILSTGFKLKKIVSQIKFSSSKNLDKNPQSENRFPNSNSKSKLNSNATEPHEKSEPSYKIKVPSKLQYHSSKDLSNIIKPFDCMQNSEFLREKKKDTIAILEALFDTKILPKTSLKVSEMYVNFKSLNLKATNYVSQQIVLFNTNSDVKLYIQPVISPGCFEISQDVIELGPNQSFELQIYFRPTNAECFYYQTLSLFSSETPVFQKTSTLPILSTAEAENSSVLFYPANTPPNEIQVHLAGNTFPERSNRQVSVAEFNPPNNLVFNPCQLGDSSFQILTITNKSDTNLFIQVKPLRPPFECFQNFLFIPKKSWSSLLIRFKPQYLNNYEQTLYLVINDKTKKQFQMSAVCLNTIVRIDANGKIEFPPSFIGVQRKQKVAIENVSKSDSTFTIKIPEEFKKQLRFEPSYFVLEPNQKLNLNCFFLPKEFGELSIECPLTVKRKLSNQTVIEKLVVSSRTGDGKISFDKPKLNFGFVKVNFSSKMSVFIQNSSPYLFRVSLRLICVDESDEIRIRLLNFLELSETECEIPGHSNKEVFVIFRPLEVCTAMVKLLMITKPDDEASRVEEFVQMYSENYIKSSKKSDRDHNQLKPRSQLLPDSCLPVANQQSAKKPSNFQSNKNLEGKAPNSKFVNGGHLDEEDYKALGIELKDEVQIEAEANYPLLKVIDLYCEDLSMASLWSMFQIFELNSVITGKLGHLLANQESSSKTSKMNFESRNSASFMNIQQKKTFVWDFGYLPCSVDETPQRREIRMTIENIGKTDLEWKFDTIEKTQYERKRSESIMNELGEGNNYSADDELHPVFKIVPK